MKQKKSPFLESYKKTPFKLVSDFNPAGSQPQAIKELTSAIKEKNAKITLLGATGTGKTFTIANIIERLGRTTLVLAHNKTLASQLYRELKSFFPKNRVEYFVSYYDYYQPESYIPSKDVYIEKDAQVNPTLERMRLSATASLISRSDTIVVASVSAIYGLGDPSDFSGLGFDITVGENIPRKELLSKLVELQFERNDTEMLPGRFRVRGNTIDLIPGYSENTIRIEMEGDKIESIAELQKVTLKNIESISYFHIHPAKHFVMPEEKVKDAIKSIMKELDEQEKILPDIESHRLKQRTMYDIEMIEETGFCKGIENYSRHFEGRKKGEPPFCLLDYFPKDFLMIIDESHQTIPQFHAMYNGDYSRKKTLVDYGFRLPSALDNRPLKYGEFEKYIDDHNVIFVSATPSSYEVKKSVKVVEQIIRPTGLIDPMVYVRKSQGQVDDLKKEVLSVIKRGDRALVTTLTKKLAEELSEHLSTGGIKTRYLHSEIDTLERSEILRELRKGTFDCLVGINLLREGLDIPEVGFIGILDADKEGFLRDARSLIQIIGRAARNSNSYVVLYADKMTDSMKNALSETERRRNIQIEYNKKHKIVPKTIYKELPEQKVEIKDTKNIPKNDIPKMIEALEKEMQKAADDLMFEDAIRIRDRILSLKKRINN